MANDKITLHLKGVQSALTRRQRGYAERRRLRAVPDLEAIKDGQISVRKVAQKYRVPKTTITAWGKRLDAAADQMLRQVPQGRPPRLDRQPMTELKSIYDQGPKAAGFEDDLWNAGRLVKLIKDKYGLDYSATWAIRIMYKWDEEGAHRTSKPSADQLGKNQLKLLHEIYNNGSWAAGHKERKWNAARLIETIRKTFQLEYSETRAKNLMYEWDPAGKRRTSKKANPKTAAGHLTEDHVTQLRSIYELGARAAGFDDDLWNARLLTHFIKTAFGIEYGETRTKYLMYAFDPAAELRVHRPAPKKKDTPANLAA